MKACDNKEYIKDKTKPSVSKSKYKSAENDKKHKVLEVIILHKMKYKKYEEKTFIGKLQFNFSDNKIVNEFITLIISLQINSPQYEFLCVWSGW